MFGRTLINGSSVARFPGRTDDLFDRFNVAVMNGTGTVSGEGRRGEDPSAQCSSPYAVGNSFLLETLRVVWFLFQASSSLPCDSDTTSKIFYFQVMYLWFGQECHVDK